MDKKHEKLAKIVRKLAGNHSRTIVEALINKNQTISARIFGKMVIFSTYHCWDQANRVRNVRRAQQERKRKDKLRRERQSTRLFRTRCMKLTHACTISTSTTLEIGIQQIKNICLIPKGILFWYFS